jgi:hypothetical protein
MMWSVPSSAPGIADWNLFAIQLAAFGSSLAGVDEAARTTTPIDQSLNEVDGKHTECSHAQRGRLADLRGWTGGCRRAVEYQSGRDG